MRLRFFRTFCLVMLLGAALPLAAAETVHLFLRVDGAEVPGDSTQTSLGRENSIEVLNYEELAQTLREAGSGRATGRRVYEPIRIVKRIDRSTPVLARALTENRVVDGVFRFYRPSSDGATAESTVTIGQGRVASIKQFTSDKVGAPLEEVTLAFQSISWTYGNVTHEDGTRGSPPGSTPSTSPSPSASASPSPSPSASPSVSPSPRPSPSLSPFPKPKPTASPTPIPRPTFVPFPRPTSTPGPRPPILRPR